MNRALSPLNNHPHEANNFLHDVLEGLSQKQKSLPSKYLYDEAGSRLFERICELDDYYLTRTEATIFKQNLSAIAECIGSHTLIIEPGAGNCGKVQPLLAELGSGNDYMPIDISPEILFAARDRIQASWPKINVHVVVDDFTQKSAWTALEQRPDRKQVIFFPGSTIGNFNPEEAIDLLKDFRSRLVSGDGLLIGADLIKDPVVLERAYHDSEHITSAFNKNILRRINRELDADFNLDSFAHRSFYHPIRCRVEMHLVSLKKQIVRIAGTTIHLSEGETIHTENSYKYSLEGFHRLLQEAGYTPARFWCDEANKYAIHFAKIS